MDITSRTIEFSNLALTGLMQRQRAIASNTANVVTPDYQRKEVYFEDKLQEIMHKEKIKDNIKGLNSINYEKNPQLQNFKPQSQELAFLNINNFEDFKPETVLDNNISNFENNNNVTLEHEMMDMAKTTTQYQVLATLQSKAFSGLTNVIKGGGTT